MMHLSFRVDNPVFEILSHQAAKHRRSLSDEVRAVIKNGLLFDVPDRKSQVAMACAIESLLIQRKLAENLADKEMVRAANQEAARIVDSVLTSEQTKLIR